MSKYEKPSNLLITRQQFDFLYENVSYVSYLIEMHVSSLTLSDLTNMKKARQICLELFDKLIDIDHENTISQYHTKKG